MSESASAAVDPMTGELVPVRVYSGTVGRDTEGKAVSDGLAITRVADDTDGPARFYLTHLGTGLAVGTRRCGQHILDAAALAAESGIDWTIPGKDDIIAAVKATTFTAVLRAQVGWLCDDHCVGDGPKPPVWSVSCSTCHWMSEPGDEPFTAVEAKRMARDHECDPEMSIRDPATGKWHDPWVVNDDGTVRDLSARKEAAR